MKITFNILKKDLKANSGNYEVCLFILLFRIGSYFKMKVSLGGIYYLLIPLRLLSQLVYRIFSMIYLMEIPLGTTIGPGLTIYHLKGIVVNPEAIIGDNVVMNHFVTIAESVVIGDRVIINPQCVIVKGEIGESAVIGAGSVVTKSVENNTVVGGCPAKVLSKSN